MERHSFNEAVIGQAIAISLEAKGINARIIAIPGAFLGLRFEKEQSYYGATLDEAVAKGLTPEQFREIIAQAQTWKDFHAPIATKVVAQWRAHSDRVFTDDRLIAPLLQAATRPEIHTALKSMARAVRVAAFRRKSKTYDSLLLEEYASRLRSLFARFIPGLRISTVRDWVFPSRLRQAALALGQLTDYGLAVRDHGVFLEHHINGQRRIELVANFEVIEIRTGVAQYVVGNSHDVHRVTIHARGESTQRDLDITGSLYDANTVRRAGGGLLAIVSARHWAEYIEHRVTVDKIKLHDRSVDRSYVFGTAIDAQQQLVLNHCVHFPHGREECYYDGQQLAPTGDKAVFGKVSALFKDHSIALIVTWGLGALLKPILDWNYPHLLVTAMHASGKTTLRDLFLRFFGWRYFSARGEFGSAYRGTKLLSNSVFPVQVDEVGRVHGNLTRMVDGLNQAYNATPSTYGNRGRNYVLVTPTLLWGQDFGSEDVALQTKMIALTLDAENKVPEALAALHSEKEVFPMREWVDHLCSWSKDREVRALVRAKMKGLEARPEIKAPTVSGAGRIFWNHAVLLTVIDALRDFGLSVNLDEYVLQLLKENLGQEQRDGDAEDRSTVPRQFISDAIEYFASHRSSHGLLLDWTEKGCFIHPRNVLMTLGGRHKYDVTSPRKLRSMIIKEGLGKPDKHVFGPGEFRCVFVPDEEMRRLGFNFGSAAKPDQ